MVPGRKRKVRARIVSSEGKQICQPLLGDNPCDRNSLLSVSDMTENVTAYQMPTAATDSRLGPSLSTPRATPNQPLLRGGRHLISLDRSCHRRP